MTLKMRPLPALAAAALACLCLRPDAGGAPLPLPPPDFADTETTVHIPVPPLEGKHFFTLALDFRASATNSLEASFGQDADGDGTLSLREAAVTLGWSRGAWRIRRRGAGGWEDYGLPGTEGRHLLRVTRWIHRGNPAQGFSVSADGAPLAFGWGASAGWLPLSALEGGLVRVTARGAGLGGAVESAAGTDGAVIIVK